MRILCTHVERVVLLCFIVVAIAGAVVAILIWRMESSKADRISLLHLVQIAGEIEAVRKQDVSLFSGISTVSYTGAAQSWRVLLAKHGLAEWSEIAEYNDEVSWDSEQNLRFVRAARNFYLSPHSSDPHSLMTNYVLLGPVNGTLLLDYPSGDGYSSDATSRSSHAMIFETRYSGFLWTEPKDWSRAAVYEDVRHGGHIPFMTDDGSHVLMTDGSVRFVSSRADKAVLMRMIE